MPLCFPHRWLVIDFDSWECLVNLTLSVSDTGRDIELHLFFAAHSRGPGSLSNN